MIFFVFWPDAEGNLQSAGRFDTETSDDAARQAALAVEESDLFYVIALEDTEAHRVAYRRRVVGLERA